MERKPTNLFDKLIPNLMALVDKILAETRIMQL